MTQLAPNRSIQSVMVIPVLHYQDVAVAAQWTFTQTIADVDPAVWGGTLV